ncbi:hypothetical protein HDK90DRAFT_556493 [Phyllosticta capitalensis]|uniref:Uncharacterized protein n=1 Tax=Phyllosticta capitalensis TaxID=121624 RepID=A0ABR1YIF0_9PEZI
MALLPPLPRTFHTLLILITIASSMAASPTDDSLNHQPTAVLWSEYVFPVIPRDYKSGPQDMTATTLVLLPTPWLSSFLYKSSLAALEFCRLDDAQIDGLCSLMCSIRAPHTQSANLTVDSTLAAAMCPSTVSDAVDIVNARLPRTCSAVAGDALQSVWEGAKWLGWLVKVLLIWAAFVVYMAGVGASMSVFMRRF